MSTIYKVGDCVWWRDRRVFIDRIIDEKYCVISKGGFKKQIKISEICFKLERV